MLIEMPPVRIRCQVSRGMVPPKGFVITNTSNPEKMIIIEAMSWMTSLIKGERSKKSSRNPVNTRIEAPIIMPMIWVLRGRKKKVIIRKFT